MINFGRSDEMKIRYISIRVTSDEFVFKFETKENELE